LTKICHCIVLFGRRLLQFARVQLNAQRASLMQIYTELWLRKTTMRKALHAAAAAAEMQSKLQEH
jgi:hypothetical protein